MPTVPNRSGPGRANRVRHTPPAVGRVAVVNVSRRRRVREIFGGMCVCVGGGGIRRRRSPCTAPIRLRGPT